MELPEFADLEVAGNSLFEMTSPRLFQAVLETLVSKADPVKKEGLAQSEELLFSNPTKTGWDIVVRPVGKVDAVTGDSPAEGSFFSPSKQKEWIEMQKKFEVCNSVGLLRLRNFFSTLKDD